jgi:ribosome-binding factor A
LNARSERRLGAPSQRQLRVGEAIRHAIAEMLMRDDLHQPALEGTHLTVTEARVSPDLRHATVFVAELGRGLRPEVQAALERVAPVLAGRVARAIHLKYAPVLRFVHDTSFEDARRIEELLIEAKRSRPPPGDGGADGGA